MRYTCCDERRLRAVKEAGLLNGIEYVEVYDQGPPPPNDPLRQRGLYVRLLQPPAGLTPEVNVRIEGGERIRTVAASTPTARRAGEAGCRRRRPVDGSASSGPTRRGDFSLYTLRLVAGGGSDEPPAGFDPQLASVDFSFKVECPTDFDCKPVCVCPPEPAEAPAIDYLAKDYDSFRALMLDRLSLLAPDWTERTPADMGVALVELLAYVGDELSYRQDAVATEAYLATARRRTSLRRHARLVDYVVHEGANARAWMRVRVNAGGVTVARGTALAHTRARPAAGARTGQPGASRRARGARGDVRDDGRRGSLRRARALRLLDVGRRGLLPAARCDVGDAFRRPSAVEGRRRARPRRGRRAA